MSKLQIRIDDDIKAAWLLKAQEQGSTLTDLIVSAVNGKTVKRRNRVNVDPALIRQLAQVGNNLNQIARWANQHKQGVDAMNVITVLVDIDREITAIRQAVEALSDAD